MKQNTNLHYSVPKKNIFLQPCTLTPHEGWKSTRVSILFHYTCQANPSTQMTPASPHQPKYFKIKQQYYKAVQHMLKPSPPITVHRGLEGWIHLYPGTPFSPGWKHDWSIALGTKRIQTALSPQQDDQMTAHAEGPSPGERVLMLTAETNLRREDLAAVDQMKQVTLDRAVTHNIIWKQCQS